ncbi:MAG TPA: hypothetical protein VK996_02430 [Ramlibacter sp.]|nr:hypothetical protein [Ramlibacter sp.]
MVERPHERVGESLHGLVSSGRRPFAILLAIGIAIALVGAVAGGLLRAGAAAALAELAPRLAANAALGHAALMMGAFMGTVIGVERCVALRRGWGWPGPVLSACGGVAIMTGKPEWGALLLAAASVVFVGLNCVLVARQLVSHTVLLLAAAACWLAGNLLYVAGTSFAAVTPWWFSFLLMTIAAERLEMTRLMRSRPGAHAALAAVFLSMVAGAALGAITAEAGGTVFGAALVALAAWLLRNDIAWRTIRTHGLPRYMAICLLTGYGWLAVGGAAWAAWSAGAPCRDLAVHAVGLGFVFSMMMAHAPVILPAVARVKVRFGPLFYAAFALLQASLAVRFFPAPLFAAQWPVGVAMTAAAIGFFAVTLLAAIAGWRRHHRN